MAVLQRTRQPWVWVPPPSPFSSPTYVHVVFSAPRPPLEFSPAGRSPLPSPLMGQYTHLHTPHFPPLQPHCHSPYRWLAQEVWPLIRLRLPTAEMSIYSSYPPTSGALHKLLHAPASGLHLRGFAPPGLAVLDSTRVLLAPLRYGTVLKGKVLDAWLHRMPVVTTPVGAEGLTIKRRRVWRRCLQGWRRFRRGCGRCHRHCPHWGCLGRALFRR